MSKKQICSKCKKVKPEVGHYARDYTDQCSNCFAKSFVESIFGKKPKPTNKETRK